MKYSTRSNKLRALQRKALSRELERTFSADRARKRRLAILRDDESAEVRNAVSEMSRCGTVERRADGKGRTRSTRRACRNPMCQRCRGMFQDRIKGQANDLLGPLSRRKLWALTINIEALPYDVGAKRLRRRIKALRVKIYNALHRKFPKADLLLLGLFEIAPIKSSKCDADLYPVCNSIDVKSDEPAFLFHMHAWVYLGNVTKEQLEVELRRMFPARNEKRIRLEQRFNRTYEVGGVTSEERRVYAKSDVDHIRDWAGYSAKLSLKVAGFPNNADVLTRLFELVEGVRGRGIQGLRCSFNKSHFRQMKEKATGPYASRVPSEGESDSIARVYECDGARISSTHYEGQGGKQPLVPTPVHSTELLQKTLQ